MTRALGGEVNVAGIAEMSMEYADTEGLRPTSLPSSLHPA
jgi:hypothetical protein